MESVQRDIWTMVMSEIQELDLVFLNRKAGIAAVSELGPRVQHLLQSKVLQTYPCFYIDTCCSDQSSARRMLVC